jgi:hypothetical protein
MKEIDGYQLLANAIVLQAVNEYREALRQNDTAAKWKKISLQRFFRSDWYKLLTNVDGEMLMERLTEEVNNDR